MPQNRLEMLCECDWLGIPFEGAGAFQGVCDANSGRMTYYIIVARAYARIMVGTYE